MNIPEERAQGAKGDNVKQHLEPQKTLINNLVIVRTLSFLVGKCVGCVTC